MPTPLLASLVGPSQAPRSARRGRGFGVLVLFVVLTGCEADVAIDCESATDAESCQGRSECVADREGACWLLCDQGLCPEGRECASMAQYKAPTDLTDANAFRDACLPPEP